ncbi:hypothetical protein [Methylocucumis oryzae]|nr:hypothetical protein [Methylocucumis oryzae]
MLVVDGPLARFNKLIRGEMLKHFYEFLNDNTIIFKDDAARVGGKGDYR